MEKFIWINSFVTVKRLKQLIMKFSKTQTVVLESRHSLLSVLDAWGMHSSYNACPAQKRSSAWSKGVITSITMKKNMYIRCTLKRQFLWNGTLQISRLMGSFPSACFLNLITQFLLSFPHSIYFPKFALFVYGKRWKMSTVFQLRTTLLLSRTEGLFSKSKHWLLHKHPIIFYIWIIYMDISQYPIICLPFLQQHDNTGLCLDCAFLDCW